MTDRHRPSVAFWTTVMLASLVLYVLSIGPACWISSRARAGGEAVSTVHRPLTWGMSHSHRIAHAISWYSRLCAADGWWWCYSENTVDTSRSWKDDHLGIWLKSF